MMLKRILAGLLLVVLAAGLLPSAGSVHAEVQTTYYVATNGSDANPGTLAAPFLTLQKARDVIRTINTNMTGDIYVYLRGGTYTLSAPLELTAADSGTNGFHVIYQNYANEAPVISGGQAVAGWSLHDAGLNIWKAAVGSTLETRQIYVNGVRANRARSTGGLPGAVEHFNGSVNDGYTTSDATMQNWGNKTDIEFVFEKEWGQPRCGVASITGYVVLMKEACFASMNGFEFWRTEISAPAYLENAYELLDAQGEWYLDRVADYLYYIPRTGENMGTAQVTAAKLETLVNGTGTLSAPIENIRFKGLTFADATWLNPNGNDGFPQIQAGAYMKVVGSSGILMDEWVLMPGNLNFIFAKGIQFERNQFKRLGAAALSFTEGSQNNEIIGNVFTDVSATSVQLGGINYNDHHPADNRSIVKNNRIANNYIHRVAAEYQGTAGLTVGYTEGTIVAHNEISDLPYTGLSFGWGWTGADYADNPYLVANAGDLPAKVTPSIAQNNLVLHNHIHNVMNHLEDGGAIYILGSQPGTRVEYNVLHGLKQRIGALYFDSVSSYIVARNNVLYDNFGNYSHALAYNNDVESNYDDGLTLAGVLNFDYTNFADNHRIEESGVPAHILDDAGLERAYADLLPEPTVNLALGKPVKAYLPDGVTESTTAEHYEASKATDGRPNTGAFSNQSYAWTAEVDLGAEYELGAVEVVFPPTDNYASEYDIQVSTTGGGPGSFTTVKSVTAGAAGPTKHTFTPAVARYIRIKAIKPDGVGQPGTQMVILELRAFGHKVSRSDNLALNKTAQAYKSDGVTVSTTFSGNEPGKGVDGDLSTYTLSNMNYNWIYEVDLGSVYTIDTVEAVFPAGAYATEYEIQVSLTGGGPSDFTTVKSVTGATAGRNTQYVPPADARFVRIRAIKPDGPAQTGNEMGVAELAVYGVRFAPLTNTLPNLALNKSAAAYRADGTTLSTTPSGYEPGKMTDGNLQTVSYSNQDYKWIAEVDLGAVQAVDTAVIHFWPGFYATQYEIQVSATGGGPGNFTTVKSIAGGAGGTATHRFAQTAARYVRIKAVKPDGASQTGTYMLISELQVYAHPNLALNKTATAYLPDGATVSTTPAGNEPDKAVDGNPATLTYSNQSYAWIQEVDLGEVARIDTILADFYATGYATEFEILVSKFGGHPANFRSVKKVTNGTGGANLITLPTPEYARYVRVKAIKPDASGQTGVQMTIKELAVFGQEARPVKTLSSANLALGKAARAYLPNGSLSTTAATREPDKAVDGLLTTFTMSNQSHSWIEEIDLGAVYKIGSVESIFLQDFYPTEYQIQVSTTGLSGSFTTVKSVTGYTGGYVDRQSFAPVDARFVRIFAVKPDGTGQRGEVMGLVEFAVFADSPVITRHLTGVNRNVALDKPTAAYNPNGTAATMATGFDAGYATDGLAGTTAMASSAYNWTLETDLQSVQRIKAITAYFDKLNWPTEFEFQISLNGSSFTTVKTVSNYYASGAPQDLDRSKGVVHKFPVTVEARYVRIKAIKPDASGQAGGSMNLNLLVTTADDALKLSQTTDARNGVDKSHYQTISDGGFTFQSGDVIAYDVQLLSRTAAIGGLDIKNTDGTRFRNQTWSDQNGKSGQPTADLIANAYQTWYHRELTIPASMAGKTAAQWMLAFENDSAGQRLLAVYDNIVVKRSGAVVFTAYAFGEPTVNQTESSAGYQTSNPAAVVMH